MTKELHYFNVNALGESIRYILHYTKQEFNDVRHTHDNWAEEKVKLAPPYGQLPLYKEGDRVLNQSLAIAKYVARGTDLIPNDPWQQAVLDSIVYTIYDFWSAATQYVREPDLDKKYDLKKKILGETIDYYFSRFEKHLKDNGGFFIGKISWAEFVLCGVVETINMFLGTELDKLYPTVTSVIEKIRNSPGVTEYIANREPYKLQFKVIQYKGLDLLTV